MDTFIHLLSSVRKDRWTQWRMNDGLKLPSEETRVNACELIHVHPLSIKRRSKKKKKNAVNILRLNWMSVQVFVWVRCDIGLVEGWWVIYWPLSAPEGVTGRRNTEVSKLDDRVEKKRLHFESDWNGQMRWFIFCRISQIITQFIDLFKEPCALALQRIFCICNICRNKPLDPLALHLIFCAFLHTCMLVFFSFLLFCSCGRRNSSH